MNTHPLAPPHARPGGVAVLGPASVPQRRVGEVTFGLQGLPPSKAGVRVQGCMALPGDRTPPPPPPTLAALSWEQALGPSGANLPRSHGFASSRTGLLLGTVLVCFKVGVARKGGCRSSLKHAMAEQGAGVSEAGCK